MSLSMSEISTLVQQDLDNVEKYTLEEIKSNVIRKTPVDTGRAKAGWKQDSNQIINEVEYIGYIETGTLHQRPVGMVATTLKEIDSLVANAVKRVN